MCIFVFQHIQFLCVIYIIVQLLSPVQLFVTWWTAALQASLSFTISQSLPRFMSVESVMTSNHLVLCCPLLLLSSIFPRIRAFSDESALHIRRQKYWASASVLPVNIQGGFPLGLIGLISLQSKSLLPHHSSKASVLRHSAFFIVQLSHQMDLCWQSNVSTY